MTDQPPAASRALPLLALGVVATAATALLLVARQHAGDQGTSAGGTGSLAEQDLELRDELAWVYETSVLVFRGAGEIAVHIHDHGGLPGLVAPLEGPPMDRVDWQEPGGARLRMHMHTLPGAYQTEVTVKVARGDRRPGLTGTAGLGGLEHEVRSSLAALRDELERTR